MLGVKRALFCPEAILYSPVYHFIILPFIIIFILFFAYFYFTICIYFRGFSKQSVRFCFELFTENLHNQGFLYIGKKVFNLTHGGIHVVNFTHAFLHANYLYFKLMKGVKLKYKTVNVK